MAYFDSHAHYWDRRFETETENGVTALLERLFNADVCGIVNVGTSLETTRLCVEQAKCFPSMFAAGGIHPGDIPQELSCAEALDALEKLFDDPASKLVALGEIGLDYHYEPFDKTRQKDFFEAQMSLARSRDLPVIIHDREAHGDSFDMVRAFPDVRGVFHSYSGSPEMAKDLVKRGYMISFSGTISFTNARSVKEAARGLPHDAVMIETDAPYLTPHPHRGKLNHSGFLPYTCAALAEAWGMSPETVAQITARNAERFFGLV